MNKIWNSAKNMADATPADRNRFIDAIRAFSILVVVFGHWLVAVVVVRDGSTTAANLLDVEPWTQWLTWGLQVMPLFFIVGGYASAASWLSAERENKSYRVWLSERLRRLLTPVIPLLVFWIIGASVAIELGVDPGMLSLATMASMVPVWFLAVYLLMTMLAPFAYRLWRRHGYAFVATLIGLAAATDVLMRAVGAITVGGLEIDLIGTVGWGNFLWVWGTMLLLGFAWHDRRVPHFGVPTFLGLGGLIILTETAGYVRSMVGVVSEGLNNNSPPSLALVALGLLQFGLVLAFEPRANRYLRRRVPWAATIVMNGLIMTTYLWHMTVMVVVIGVGLAVGGVGLDIEPATAAFWATRPLVISVYLLVTIPVVLTLSRLERPRPAATHPSIRQLGVGTRCVFAGLAITAKNGLIDGASVNWAAALLPLVGAGLIGLYAPAATEAETRVAA